MHIDDFQGMVREFELVDPIKVDRVLNGITNNRGEITPGIMVNGEFDEDRLLAEYDKIGGLIRLDGNKVKIGSFYDFRNRKAFEKPEVMLTFKVNGKFVDVPADKELPPIVKAAKVLEDEAAADMEAREEAKEQKKRGRKTK